MWSSNLKLSLQGVFLNTFKVKGSVSQIALKGIFRFHVSMVVLRYLSVMSVLATGDAGHLRPFVKKAALKTVTEAWLPTAADEVSSTTSLGSILQASAKN